MLNPHQIRSDFPILGRQLYGLPLAYLDTAATAQKPVQVLDAIDSFYTQHNANVHRGVYLLSEEATILYEQARTKMAQFIGATASSLVFTKSTTESINLVAQSWGTAQLKAGDKIVLTQMEHHANLLPWQRLAQQSGAQLVFIPIDLQTGQLVDDWSIYIDSHTKLVALSHLSNVLGTINPIGAIIEAAHQVGAKVLVDAAQSLPAMSVDVDVLDIDFLVASGHKLYGPTGIGILYAKPELLERMEPYQLGGQMIDSVTFEGASWRTGPSKFEAGTPPIAQAIGLAAAVEYLQQIGLNHIQSHLRQITQYAITQLQQFDDIEMYGPTDISQRSSLVSFNLGGLHPHDLADHLDSHGVAIRAGHHCAQPLVNLLGRPAVARASFAIHTTPQDIDQMIAGLKSAHKTLT